MNPTWEDVMKFNLPENPVLFDVGGYKGDWTQIALNKYVNPTIYVFEPVVEFYNIIVNRYKDNPNIKVFNFGLSSENKIEKISLNEDSSSVFVGDNLTDIKLVNIIDFLHQYDIFHVDLIKINIEGEEYRLLNHLIQYPELNIFQNFLVQFHNFIENHVSIRNKILEEVLVYYDMVFNYEFIFEGWSIKKKQKINCIGDSHISIFSGLNMLIPENKTIVNDNFHVLRFGPYLANSFPNKENIFKYVDTIPKNENLLICFGEIDCRAQIKNQTEKNGLNYKKVIDGVIFNYFNGIDKLTHKNIILFSVTPELKETPFKIYYDKNPEDFDAPKGSYDERKLYKEYFNYKVKEQTELRGFKFISIYEYLVNEKNTNNRHSLDDIHLTPKKVSYIINREIIKAKLTL